MLDPSDRIDVGPRSPDAGSAEAGAPDARPNG
jgi:hypothetical protein